MRKLSILTLASALTAVLALSSCQQRSSSPAPATAATGTILDPQTREEIVTKARHNYYNLHEHKLQGFQCDVFIDWEAVPYAREEQLVAYLKMVTFHVVVDAAGATKPSHESRSTPSDEELAKRMQFLIANNESGISNIIKTWAPFAINSPFQEPADDYTVEQFGNQYRLTQKDKKGSLVIVMNHDLTIDHLETTAANGKDKFSAAFKFIQGPGGFMLDSVDSIFTSAEGQTFHDAVKYTYQQVKGFQLPRAVTLIVYLPGATATPFTFANCQVKRG